jgi:hypothetical protein
MSKFTTGELQEAIGPISSLISKSEKAQQKLKPGTWQHTMLQQNLRALHIASALMRKTNDADELTQEDFQTALRAFAVMTDRSEQAQSKFAPGTSQHTLQRNRLKAFRTAEALIKDKLK